jgi:cellulose synthase/poly-beta-1,6-N-acetylglucosamine synthase-like glycosyltransferase/peptidoglycan/xylan/chitin deacetylase (PgdA/CDA1 family)/spore germination protein YaaH
MSSSSPDKFVFLDLGGKRWPRARRLVVLLGLLLFVASVFFVQSLLIAPQLVLPLKLKKLKEQLKALQKQGPVVPNTADANDAAVRNFYRSPAGKDRLKSLRDQLTAKPARPAKVPGHIRLAYTVAWDPTSYDSLVAHADKITHVCPEWFTLTNSDGTFSGENDVQLLQFLSANKRLVLLPMMSNLSGDTRMPEAVENLAHGPAAAQQRFIDELKHQLGDIHAGGVLIDWEGIDAAYENDLTTFLAKVADGLHDANLELWLQIPVGEERHAYDIETLSDSVDYFVASLHDQVSEDDPPGPVAAENWFRSWLDAVASYQEPAQWIISIGNYGYDWEQDTAPGSRTGWKKADTISFADAMSRAAYAGEGSTESGAPEYIPSFDYTLAGVDHEVWFLDAVSFLNQARDARAKGFDGLAINRLGTEDPQVWTALDLVGTPHLTTADLAQLQVLKTGKAITNIGEGEIVTADISPEEGKRQVELEPKTGLLTTAYQKFPQYPTLYHQGAGGEHQVAITFDDGPDPTWTPKILDVLKQKNAPAAFFILGQQAENYPGIVRRIVAEGHEFGSHTYTHVNLSLVGEQRERIELDATQRLLQAITGRSTTLFRPPYEADSRPDQLSEVTPLIISQDLDYLTVMENIDAEDWARPGADVILQRIKQQRRNGSIILLHDAGGDRSQTVEALPKIIDYLRARGDRIVSLSELLGTTRDALNPPLRSGDQSLARLASSLGFRFLHAAFGFLWAFMIVATALIVLRTLLIIGLALRHRARASRPVHPASDGCGDSLSVVIAAYNEEKVLAATLASVLNTDFEGPLELIVVDDGSKDETRAVAEEVAAGDPRVRVFHQANAGKSEALRRGVELAQYDALVFLDADTQFQPDTLPALAAPLADPQVGAVSGHARVGNVGSFIARCQSLEYICGFNLDRRAYDALNCITVAPGAISAISREALQAAGGFRSDTLAEDTDLTLGLHRCGYRVRYAANAIAWTEAPETLRALAKQRFRWCFGTMQCLWKHRDMLFNPRFKALGFFSLPSVWFFQIILVALTPMVDLLLLSSILLGDGRAVLPYFLIFLVLDQILALLACALEREPLSRSWIMIPMRLIYRPLLSWVVWKSIINAARGVLVGWGKLERTASVRLPEPLAAAYLVAEPVLEEKGGPGL